MHQIGAIRGNNMRRLAEDYPTMRQIGQGDPMHQELLRLFAGRKGHFRLESGHHGDLWLDLELLCLRPVELRPFAVELSQRIAEQNVEAVCGPLIEGAFVALMVASELNVEFSYAEPLPPQNDGLFPVKYRIPPVLRRQVKGKRVAIINDVINAGSAVRGTFRDLKECGAEPVVVGALLVLGSSARSFAAENDVRLESIAALPSALWTPAECPLCAAGVSLNDPLVSGREGARSASQCNAADSDERSPDEQMPN